MVASPLGLLGPDDYVQSIEREFNDGLEASVADVPEEFRAKLTDIFGDQIAFKGDKAVWQGNLIGDLVDDVIGAEKFRTEDFRGRSISLGTATQQAVEKATPVMDISGLKMNIRPDNIIHIRDEHDAKHKTDSTQRPVTKLDFELMPHVWREPDDVQPGNKPRSLLFMKKLLGNQYVVEWRQYPNEKAFQPNTMWIKK